MRPISSLRLSLAAALAWVAAPILGPQGACAEGFNYPETERVDQVDDYHGTVVQDPYRWLETDVRESEAVADEWAFLVKNLCMKIPGLRTARRE
ncbi:MAG: hypothetical protein V3T81_00350 [Thermoanaerobaculia bacterium]